MTKELFLILLFSSVLILKAQQYPYVTKLTGTPQPNGSVNIELSISQSTFTASGFDIQRSSDSAFNFVSVFYYNGAVGGANTFDYSYYDSPPDPTKKYYYKVVFPNGSESATIIVNMGDVYGNYRILGHPVASDGESRLQFPYVQGQLWILEIADPKGYFLYRLAVTQNDFIINASWFKGSGIYLFRLYPSDGSVVIPGRFVVLKQGI